MSKVNQKKYLDNLNEKEIRDQISNKEALPELAFKLTIFDAEKSLVEAEKILMYNKRLNRGRIDFSDQAKFESLLVGLFNHIKYMLLDKKLINSSQVISNKLSNKDFLQSDFVKLQNLERGAQYDLNTLLNLKEFLIYGLHKLKLTDLLRETSFDWEAEFKSQY